MKKCFKTPVLSVLILSVFLIAGCTKDNCHKTYRYSYYIPVYKTREEVKVNIKSNPPKDIQNPGKLFILGKYIFLNELDKGIHIIDNSNPASPLNVAFIDIAGNMDLAVKGSILYADAYSDLVTIDISNPLNVVVKKYNQGVFPFRGYNNGFVADANRMIVDWIKKDTVISGYCEGNNMMLTDASVFYSANPAASSGSSKVSVSPIGQGGSMARFALINNYLYTVDDNQLNAFNVTDSANPAFTSKTQVDWHVETLYPFKDKLFVGSNNGIFMYDVASSPGNPVKAGEFTHARACDPVIADDSFAFVTLHSGTDCLGFNNELDVVRLNSLVNATLAKTYSLASPRGLSKDGNILFICDGTAGLKIYDAANPLSLQPIKEFADIETYDVIAYNKIALVIAKDGLYQYDYSNINNIHLLSKTSIVK